MLNRRRQVAVFFGSESWLRSHTSWLTSALGLVAISPEIADATRKGDRRDDDQSRKNDGAEIRDDRKARAEVQDSSDKSDKSEKRDRVESRNDRDDRNDKSESGSGKAGDESKRQNADSESSSRETSAEEDDSHQHGGRHIREFEQRAEDVPADNAPDSVSVTQENPNVVIDDVPATSVNDLVVEANDNVIASVSTSGGFAFARSGGVTAVTGPDGASIIQTGDVTTGTNETTPTEPSDDGGNNDVDFSS